MFVKVIVSMDVMTSLRPHALTAHEGDLFKAKSTISHSHGCLTHVLTLSAYILASPPPSPG